MKYIGMPAGMWLLFRNSFRNNLTAVLGFSKSEAAEITEKALLEYKRIIGRLPEFEKGDRFKMNIISCATLCAFILSMPEKPEPDKMTDYYREAMMTGAMKWFCKTKGKDKFTEKDLAGMKYNEQMQAAEQLAAQQQMDAMQQQQSMDTMATAAGAIQQLQAARRK